MASQVTGSALLAHSHINQRLVNMILSAAQDKNSFPRICSAHWLTTIIKTHAVNRWHIENSQSVEIIEKILKKGLGDSNPAVRTCMREAFICYIDQWPENKDNFLRTMEPAARSQLEKAIKNMPSTTHISAHESVKKAHLGSEHTGLTKGYIVNNDQGVPAFKRSIGAKTQHVANHAGVASLKTSNQHAQQASQPSIISQDTMNTSTLQSNRAGLGLPQRLAPPRRPQNATSLKTYNMTTNTMVDEEPIISQGNLSSPESSFYNNSPEESLNLPDEDMTVINLAGYLNSRPVLRPTLDKNTMVSVDEDKENMDNYEELECDDLMGITASVESLVVTKDENNSSSAEETEHYGKNYEEIHNRILRRMDSSNLLAQRIGESDIYACK